MNQPDENEILAEKYLRSLAIGDVSYEPNGNQTPDFSIGNQIAAEVRFLTSLTINIHGITGHQKILYDIVKEANKDYYGKHCFICLSMTRPYPEKSVYKQALRSFLTNIDSTRNNEWTDICSNTQISITFFEPSSDCPRIIVGITTDHSQSGFTCSMICEAIKHSISDKNSKTIHRPKHNYKEWWLILVNKIGGGTPLPDEYPHYDRAIRESCNGQWNRVIILDGMTGSVFYDCLL